MISLKMIYGYALIALDNNLEVTPRHAQIPSDNIPEDNPCHAYEWMNLYIYIVPIRQNTQGDTYHIIIIYL